MSHLIVLNKNEIVDDAKLIPADEWNQQRYTPFARQKWCGRLLFFLTLVETLVFGSWITLCPGCNALYRATLITLFNYSMLTAVLLSFGVAVCIFCYVESAMAFLSKYNFLLYIFGLLPISTFILDLIVMFCYSVFITSDFVLDGTTYECLTIEGTLCILCTISGYVSSSLLKEAKDESIDITSFHASAVVIAQE